MGNIVRARKVEVITIGLGKVKELNDLEGCIWHEDGKTVRGMDVLFPKIGEIIGGSERESSLEKLNARIDELGMGRESLEWYLDTRRFGSAPHSGFGLGFERLLLFVTGMANIRDVIPFPRTPKNAEY